MKTITLFLSGLLALSANPALAWTVTFTGDKGHYTFSEEGVYIGCVKNNGCVTLGPQNIVINNETGVTWKNGEYYYYWDAYYKRIIVSQKGGKIIFIDNFNQFVRGD